MAGYYFDTSALLKRYVLEAGTPAVLALTDPSAGHDLYCARLAGPELVAALARRAVSEPAMADELGRLVGAARFDLAYRLQLVELTPALGERAMELAERRRLRGADAVHLAAALAVRDALAAAGLARPTFVSADREQLAAAHAEGLAVQNPAE